MMQDVMKHFVHLEKNSSEFGEKVAKATDDLGKNLTKAGDKLLAVWDLNDLKDDTIEMKDRVQAVDLDQWKEGLDQHVRGANKQLGPLGAAIRTNTKELLQATRFEA